ncbi:MAG: hypothetical protein K2L17_10425 [Muribaculaceae bacterium]|nr:hypothetical protein [Muribaculaceae bacterium]
MKKIISIVTILLVLMSSLTTKSETYLKGEFASSNIWIDLLGILATYAINKPKKNIVVDSYLTFSGIGIDVDPYINKTIISTSSDNIIKPLYGFKLQELFNGFGTGIKYGYRNDYEYFLKSWAVYGSLHETYNYYLIDVNIIGEGNKTYGNSVLRLSPGIGTNITLGKYTSPVYVLLDFNLKYDIPIIYKGYFGSGPGCLKSGYSPRITAIVGGPHLRKLGLNVGVFYEWMNYNLFKPSEYFIEPYKSKGMTFGMNVTMYPWN